MTRRLRGRIIVSMIRTSILYLWFLAASPVASSAQSHIVALTHVTLIDGTGAPPRSDLTLIIRGNRISTIGLVGQVEIPIGARVIDGQGGYLVPGLWDMHVHLQDLSRDIPLLIANGITGVRDMGSTKDGFKREKALRRSIARGATLGPRMVLSGPMLNGPRSHQAPHDIAAATEPEARRGVEWLKAHGADFVKVHSAPSREVFLAIIDEGRKAGLPVVGHVPYAVTAWEAVAAGEHSIEHMMEEHIAVSSEEAAIRVPIVEVWRSGRGDPFIALMRAEARARTNYSRRKADSLYRLMIERHTWQSPSLTGGLWNWLLLKKDSPVLQDPRLRYLPRGVTLESDLASLGSADSVVALFERLYRSQLTLTGEMHRAGIPMLAGTDLALVGFTLHEEMAQFVMAGLTPMEALQTATRNPARFLNTIDSLGTVETGKLADLVLLEENPLESIENTRRISAVVVNGRYLDRAALNRLLAGVERPPHNPQR